MHQEKSGNPEGHRCVRAVSKFFSAIHSCIFLHFFKGYHPARIRSHDPETLKANTMPLDPAAAPRSVVDIGITYHQNVKVTDNIDFI
jgi:hypothetical protein